MKYLLNAVYISLLMVALPWLAWRVFVQKKNRRGWKQKLLGLIPFRQSDKPCIWIHAVSVGEVNLLSPLIEQIESEYPGHEICVSTTTETGFDLANKNFADKFVFFCPSDFSWAVANVIDRLRPQLIVLTELELWPNLIATAKHQSIPIALINGRISEKSFNGYRRYRFLTRPMFASLDVAAVQTEAYADRLFEMGTPAKNIHITGNIKFDNCDDTIHPDRDRLMELTKIDPNKEFIIVAGSTQQEEDIMAIEVYRQLKTEHPNLRLILVPRHPDRRQRILNLLHEQNLPVIQRSLLDPNQRESKQPEHDAVILIDVIGELKLWWSIANVAYVGGSMGTRGGQNMIEPAAFGAAVCFGPRTANFKDVVEMMLGQNAAKVVANSQQLKDFVLFALGNPQAAHDMGQRARQLTKTQKGAVNATSRLLQPVLTQLPPKSRPKAA